MRHFRLEYISLYLHRISVFTQNLGQTPYYAEFIKPNTRLPNEPDEVHQFLILRRGGEVLYFRTEAPDDLREHLDEFADIFNQYSELA